MNRIQTAKHRRAWVRAVLVGIATATGPLLVGACAETDQPAYEAAMGETLIPEDIRIEENTHGPDVILDEGPVDVTVWALINAADPYGVAVQGVKDGDIVTIQSIGGMGITTIHDHESHASPMLTGAFGA